MDREIIRDALAFLPAPHAAVVAGVLGVAPPPGWRMLPTASRRYLLAAAGIRWVLGAPLYTPETLAGACAGGQVLILGEIMSTVPSMRRDDVYAAARSAGNGGHLYVVGILDVMAPPIALKKLWDQALIGAVKSGNADNIRRVTEFMDKKGLQPDPKSLATAVVYALRTKDIPLAKNFMERSQLVVVFVCEALVKYNDKASIDTAIRHGVVPPDAIFSHAVERPNKELAEMMSQQYHPERLGVQNTLRKMVMSPRYGLGFDLECFMWLVELDGGRLTRAVLDTVVAQSDWLVTSDLIAIMRRCHEITIHQKESVTWFDRVPHNVWSEERALAIWREYPQDAADVVRISLLSKHLLEEEKFKLAECAIREGLLSVPLDDLPKRYRYLWAGARAYEDQTLEATLDMLEKEQSLIDMGALLRGYFLRCERSPRG